MSYKHSYNYKQRHFRLCVPLCPRHFGWGYTQSICCLFGSEACESVVEGADCLRLHSPRLSSRFCRGRAAAVIVGIAHRSADGLETARAAVLPPLSESSRRSGLRQVSRELSAHIFAGRRGIHAIYVWFVRELGMHSPPLRGQAVSIHNRTTYLGVVWYRPRCRHVFLLLGSSHPCGSQESGSRPVTHCEVVSTTAGSDGSCIQRDTFWSAVHETPTVVAQDQGVLPERKPALHDQGPGVGSSLSPRNASDGRVPHRLGSGHEWPPRPRSVERSPSSLAHQLPGDAGHVSGLLRAGPSGAEWGPPRSTVPVSPQCLREISLPTLPVLQGAAVSSEPTPQSLPPGNVAELGSSPPLRGHRASSSHKSRGWSRETGSPSRLLAAWKLLPNVSAWVLRTVERGYRIQFGAPPPPFNGVFPTVVNPEQGLVMEQEVETLLRKQAIEVVPPHDRESRFYSRYFTVLKKDGGLRPILDLRQLNRSVMRLKFKMLTIYQVVSQIRSEDWFVTIDLKDAYFHVSILPQHRKFLRFAFRGEAYQYRVLPFGLALSPGTFRKCVDAALAPLRLRGIHILNYIDDWLILAQSEHIVVQHRDVVLAHMKELGLRLNAKKSVLSPLQRTTSLGMVWDSTTMQARLSPARIESILTAVTRVKEGRSLTVKQFQRLLGLMAAASNVIPFGLLYMRPPLTESSSCSWASQYGSRHPVEAGAEARGMGSPGTGCHGTDVAEALSVRLSPDRSVPGSSGESVPGRGPSSFSSPILAGPSMVLGPDFPSRRLSMGDSRQEESPLSGRRHHPPPSPKVVEVMDVAPEGAHLVASGLSTEVVQTILQSRAPSTRKLYALKWKLFTSWCGHRQQDPVNCPVGTVLEYLQDRFSAGLAHSTLRVYVEAISAYHAPLGGMSVGKDPLVVSFLCCALRLRPPTALLLALTSLKRVGDLQALSVAPSHLEFAPGMAKAFLYPSAGYVPYHGPLYSRPFVLLPFGIRISRS
ncbi:Transposon Ty3-G Gag-Pol polyprotein [Labeo rohita]|uniref:ribonuclease H n=1 Tax=Labeo rohita TaxID=84645 RepID=A0ABQ8MY57_LABRO|nr:Transposon Ty3-G Gag-Pol polyprotein [Labeo rohita]